MSHFRSNSYIEYESNGDKNITLSVEEYINKARPYLKDIINNLKNFETWRIQLTISNKFIFSIDNYEERVIHSKSDNIEIMISEEADEVTKELFDSLEKRYQNNLESMKSCEFVFDYVLLLIINVIKKNLNHGGSNIDSPDLIKFYQ